MNMEELALSLSCNLTTYKSKTGEMFFLYVSSIDNINIVINYFDKYLLIGDKLNDFNKWKIVYNMIISKEGRLKIRALINKQIIMM